MAKVERLSALDATFLALDSREAPFNVGAVAVFDADGLRERRQEGLDRNHIRRLMEAMLEDVPRYRQRIARTPLLRQPVWVDDSRFELNRHVQFTRVSSPGGDAELWDLTGRILAIDLDLHHPPWSMWFADGLARDRFAVIAVAHHCMVDGVAGVQLLERMLNPTYAEHPPSSSPLPGPRRAELLRAEIKHRARSLRGLAHLPDLRDLARTAGAIGRTLGQAVRSASDAGINPAHIGRGRRYAGGSFPLDEVRDIKRALGGTVNDAVLAIVSGALRPHLCRRDVDPERLDDFRAMLPVNVRAPGDERLGNRVALMLARLPVDERDPARRLRRVSETTRFLKTRSGQANASAVLEQLANATTRRLVTVPLRVGLRRRAFNVVITNIPGPQVGLDFAGARLRAFYPIVNLWPRQTIGVALFSYDGVLYWGLTAERQAVRDLDQLSEAMNASFEELRAAAARSHPALFGRRPSSTIGADEGLRPH